jgi:1-deoxy-D-xylulose-5-phosphate synthase
MASGTGMGAFAKNYPTRFFDVGIAEEHAVTFGAGLAANDKLPVCAIYSTFVQRVYDQLIHDVAIQKLPMIMALDRCGLVPGDGVTHQGIYDCSYLSSVPGIEIISPETYAEMREAFDDGIREQRFRVIRYPKGSELQYDRNQFETSTDLSYMDTTPDKKNLVIITYGRITKNAYLAIEKLKEDYAIRLIKLIKIFPLEIESLVALCGEVAGVYILEEGLKTGGIGEKLAAEFAQNDTMRTKKIVIRVIENPLIEQGNLESLYDAHHLSAEHIEAEIKETFKK